VKWGRRLCKGVEGKQYQNQPNGKFIYSIQTFSNTPGKPLPDPLGDRKGVPNRLFSIQDISSYDSTHY
jgi:hypothetical protein